MFLPGSENVGYRRERLPSNVFKMAYAINRNFHFDFTIMTLNIQYTYQH